MYNLFFIDYETTGLNPYHNEPIEIAVKKIDSNSYYQTLIIPSINGISYLYIPPEITNITGIRDKDIKKEGIGPEKAIYNTLKYIQENSEEGPIYIIAHNGTTFDFIFFKKAIYEYNQKRNTRNNSLNMDIIKRIEYIDSLLLSKLILKDGIRKQSILCKKYNIQNDSEHRSLGDILSLEKLYSILCEQLSYINKKEKTYYLNNPSEIVRLTMY